MVVAVNQACFTGGLEDETFFTVIVGGTQPQPQINITLALYSHPIIEF
jgi:hypothetical protein